MRANSVQIRVTHMNDEVRTYMVPPRGGWWIKGNEIVVKPDVQKADRTHIPYYNVQCYDVVVPEGAEYVEPPQQWWWTNPDLADHISGEQLDLLNDLIQNKRFFVRPKDDMQDFWEVIDKSDDTAVSVPTTMAEALCAAVTENSRAEAGLITNVDLNNLIQPYVVARDEAAENGDVQGVIHAHREIVNQQLIMLGAEMEYLTRQAKAKHQDKEMPKAEDEKRGQEYRAAVAREGAVPDFTTNAEDHIQEHLGTHTGTKFEEEPPELYRKDAGDPDYTDNEETTYQRDQRERAKLSGEAEDDNEETQG